MEVFLRSLLPRLLGNVPFEVHPFQCKEELLARLAERMRGYAAWLPRDQRIMVLVDRDDDDCQALKRELEHRAHQVGLSTRSRPVQGHYTVVNRIVVEELEAWYFGDWQAVCAAYPRVSPKVARRAAYRDPDGIPGGTWEAFERVLQRAGYFRSGLRKREIARTIVPHLDPERNRSASFRVFRRAVLDLAVTP